MPTNHSRDNPPKSKRNSLSHHTQDTGASSVSTDNSAPTPQQESSVMTISEMLLSKLEQIHGDKIPTIDSDDIYFMGSLLNSKRFMDRNTGGMFLIALLGLWLKGEREWSMRKQKREVNKLRRAGLVIYDDIRDILMIDEKNLLQVLEEEFPSQAISH